MLHPTALRYCDPQHPAHRAPLSALTQALRPAGGGVYVVSTGVEQQRALQRAIYQVEDATSIQRAWEEALERALRLSERAGSSALLLGVPSDTGAGFTRGANLAPAELRAHLLAHHPQHSLLSPHTIDVGDVRVIPQLLSEEMLSESQYIESARALYGGELDQVSAELPVTPLDITALSLSLLTPPHSVTHHGQEVTSPERAHAVTPIVIGGDHSVAWPAFLAAFERWERSGQHRLGLLHFDAHTDLLSERLGVKYCFATWAWHANQLLGADGRLVQVGIRASGRDRAHWEETCHLRQIWADEANERGAEAVADEIIERFERLGVSALYVSNDIDGTDESFAGATGTPEPGGLTPDLVNEVTRRVGERFPLIGADLVEVAPPLCRAVGEPERTLDTAASYLETLAQLALARAPLSS